ncbi:MAG: hypothetical protein AAB467_00795 [Patescibacteria group bacterium]
MFPPHLPPPFSNIRNHQQFERLKIILVATFFGLLAGLSGASMLLGWIWPLTGGGDNFFLSRSSSGVPREQLQARAQAKIADEIFTIYQKATVLGAARYFSELDKVADAVMGVTSGWVVAYAPNFVGLNKEWVAVAENGSLYNVSRPLFDRRTGLLYLKLSRAGVSDQQFRVVNFNSGLKQYDEVFVFQDGQWHSTMVTGQSRDVAASHLDSVLTPAYSLNDKFRTGSVVIDVGGNLIGFVNDHSVLTTLTVEDYFLNGIENKKVLTYRSFGVEGCYTDEKLLVMNDEKLTGFIVNRVLANKQFFQKGDIILKVDGRPADRTNVWNSLLNSSVRVSIWRNGKVIESSVSVVEL